MRMLAPVPAEAVSNGLPLMIPRRDARGTAGPRIVAIRGGKAEDGRRRRCNNGAALYPASGC